MARYRVRSEGIEAEQWQPGRAVVGVDELVAGDGSRVGRVVTELGVQVVSPGDWILRTPEGAAVVVPAAQFAVTYEVVPAVPAAAPRGV